MFGCGGSQLSKLKAEQEGLEQEVEQRRQEVEQLKQQLQDSVLTAQRLGQLEEEREALQVGNRLPSSLFSFFFRSCCFLCLSWRFLCHRACVFPYLFLSL